MPALLLVAAVLGLAQPAQCPSLTVETARSATIELYSMASGTLEEVGRIEREAIEFPVDLLDCGDATYLGWQREDGLFLVLKSKFIASSCVCPSRAGARGGAPGGAPGSGALNACPIEQC